MRLASETTPGKNKGTLLVNGISYSGGGGSASVEYGDETDLENWAITAKDGDLFVRTDDNPGGSIPSGTIDVSDKFSIYDGRVNKANFNASKIGDLIILSGYLTVLKALTSAQTSILIADEDVLPIDSFYFSFVHTSNDVHTSKIAQCNSSSRNINFNHNGLSVNDKLYINVFYKVVM